MVFAGLPLKTALPGRTRRDTSEVGVADEPVTAGLVLARVPLEPAGRSCTGGNTGKVTAAIQVAAAGEVLSGFPFTTALHDGRGGNTGQIASANQTSATILVLARFAFDAAGCLRSGNGTGEVNGAFQAVAAGLVLARLARKTARGHGLDHDAGQVGVTGEPFAAVLVLTRFTLEPAALGQSWKPRAHPEQSATNPTGQEANKVAARLSCGKRLSETIESLPIHRASLQHATTLEDLVRTLPENEARTSDNLCRGSIGTQFINRPERPLDADCLDAMEEEFGLPDEPLIIERRGEQLTKALAASADRRQRLEQRRPLQTLSLA